MIRKEWKGIVKAANAEKTIVVLVTREKKNDLYGRSQLRSKKYHAHDEDNIYKKGDEVTLVEIAPKSKLKKWAVLYK